VLPQELGSTGVRINSISPGPVATDQAAVGTDSVEQVRSEARFSKRPSHCQVEAKRQVAELRESFG
jgi:NAD(P)-dependent dehydrogenase (short-subunit alcohol dehydrogenase family)